LSSSPIHKFRVALLAGAAALTLAASATAAPAGGDTISLVAYSTPREAYAELIPLFQKTAAGKDVQFTQSYGSSGEQARAVASGLDADIVHLSLAPDVDKLAAAGKVSKTWRQDAFRGMATSSVVVLVVRQGNPKGIKSWKDLVKPDVEVITPNPFTSGGARWNLMAAYGAQRKLGRTHAQSIEYLRGLLKNVPVQDKSARESLQTFSQGKGDVLLAYENEAIFAKSKGQPIEYIVPAQTILIENPIAVTTTSDAPAAAKAFVNWLRTPEAQKVWAKWGYRPLNAAVRRQFPQFKNPAGLFAIDSLGGWKTVQTRFFGLKNGEVTKLERELGVSTG
jgi:sulfate/thiosulfate transport system substrate-binding protein